MPSLRDQSFLKSVKGKVVLAFLIGSLALAASWTISKITFDNMLVKLEVLSTPSDQLRLVNKLFKSILQLDQLQNERTVKGDPPGQMLLAQSAELMAYLDSLTTLCLDNPLQIVRLDSMRRILKGRENIYGDYVKERSKLVSNRALSDEVKSISGLITTNKLNPDSTVVKTEKRVTTTTVYTVTPESVAVTPEKKGLINRVFGSKKSKKTVAEPAPRIVQKQEVNVVVDTLKVAELNPTIEKVGEAVKAIETSQKLRTNRFIDREQELTSTGNTLVRQLLRVMQDVEQDVVRDANREGTETQTMVAASVARLEYVMMGFFFITAVLAYLIFTDISRSNQYRSELEEAKEEAEYHSMAKQRFLSNMSHEIRTPLQSIIGYTEALKNSDKPKQQDLDTLHAASEHLLYLVNDVLDYNRIISNQFTFEERTFAITPLLNEVIQMLRPNSISKSLVLTLDSSLPADLYLKGDPFRIRQVLYNLLTNAIKFTEQGEVRLTVGGKEMKRGFRLELQIADTGIGLSDDQIHRVFNQFEQADASIARRYGGTGLGLSIVKSLVERMSGTIRVNSKLGEGTTFLVNIMVQKTEMPEDVKSEKREAVNFDGKVWLVDDDAFILKWCASVLQTHGVKHRTFSSAEEVLSHPWDPEVTVVFTDMRMSGMNGAELRKRLRKTVPANVRFYVLTAQALPEERAMLMQLGFDGILMKPFHSHELIELLQPSEKPAKNPVETGLDFTALNEMTFGDESLLREVLEQFVRDMRQDLAELGRSSEPEVLDAAADLSHRLAGRTGQLGMREVSEKFRNAEIRLRASKESISGAELKVLIHDTEQVVNQVEEKALSYSI
jgi:signal transduction histidine kinase/FixJ family two-component response regulator